MRAPPVPPDPSIGEAARSVRARLDEALAEVARLDGVVAARDAELRAVRAGRSRFIARTSHALRTPLNGIIGMAEMMGAGELDDPRRQCAERLTGSAQALLGTVNGLLDHALLESGELRLQRSRFALHELVEEGCQRRAGEAHVRGVELVCYIDEGVPRDVDGDGTRLWQVIDALVANAIEHTDRGEVVVRVMRDGEVGGVGGDGNGVTRSRYRCDVQDTGSGLSPEDQLRLWQVFRGESGDAAAPDDDDAQDAQDAGQGLRTAGEIARRMGGELDVRSRLGEGSRFSFTFVLGDVESAGGGASGALRGARALIVDDNETNRTILSHQLGNWGLRAESVDGGAAALDALRAARDADEMHDLLVLDLHMPGMDGLELARRIADDPTLRGVPTLLLTSSQIELDEGELDALGVERNLTKPAKQSVLHDTLASMLHRAGSTGTGGSAADRSHPVREQAGPTPERVPGAPAGPDGEPDAPALLDPEALAGIRALERPEKPGLLARVSGVWSARVPELVAAMRDALQADDAAALLAAVHELKSSSDYLGARTIVARCRDIEAALDASPDGGTAGAAALVDALDVEREAVCRALDESVRRAA